MIFGVNPTLEALRAGHVIEIQVSETGHRGAASLIELAARLKVPVRRATVSELDRISGHGLHQGVVATVNRHIKYRVDELLDWETGPLLVVLDGVEDPRNVGAIARAVDAAGAGGIVLQTRRAAATTGAAVKASAGAISYVRLAPVVNISRALEGLKADGVWVVGLDEKGRVSLIDLDLTVPTAFVLGAEGKGLRRLVQERCDWLASLPMQGKVASLNVSVAAGIALFEAVRQRQRR